MKEMTEHLSRLVPCASQSALVVQLSTPKQPARELAWYGNGDVSKLIEYGRRFVHEDPMLPAAKRADGTPQLLSDFVKVGSDWFTGEYLRQLRVKRLMGVSHRMPDGSVLLFALHRQQGPNFGAREIRLLGAVSSDLARAALGPVLKAQIRSLTEGMGNAAVFLFGKSGNAIHADMAGLALDETTRRIEVAVTKTARSFLRSRARDTTARLRIGSSRGRIRLRRFPEGTDVAAVAVLSRSDAADSELLPADILLRLTPREQEIAGLAAQRLANDEIADRLGLSVETVRTHLKRVYTKVGARGRRDLACSLPSNGA